MGKEEGNLGGFLLRRRRQRRPLGWSAKQDREGEEIG